MTADKCTDLAEHPLFTAPGKQNKTFTSGDQMKVWYPLKQTAVRP